VSKEKFDLAFMAGGALLDVLGTRLRREPADPREAVGAAVHTMGQALEEHQDKLADAEAVRRQIAMIRQELCAAKPRRAVLAGYVEELADQVRPVGELADAAEAVRRQIAAYLRWRFGRWSIS
jgi:hypothetical protein